MQTFASPQSFKVSGVTASVSAAQATRSVRHKNKSPQKAAKPFPGISLNRSGRYEAPVSTTNARKIHITNCRIGAESSEKDSLAEWNLLDEVVAGRLALPVALSVLLPVQEAMAAGGEYGLFEKKAAALTHPVIMAILFVATGYAGYLGWQWRTVRTVGDEISELKKQLPAKNDEGVSPPAPELEAKIEALSATRKELMAGNFRERHYNWGNLLLSLGVLTSVAGGMNTYLRVGKLFPGPHLYAGVGITVLWALAAALVPYMQKGNTTARNAHIALNSVNLALFAWQIPTGWEITQKVWKFVSW